MAESAPSLAAETPCGCRLTVTYPATDGSVPESLDVVWEGCVPDVADLAAIVRVLASVPARRHEMYLTGLTTLDAAVREEQRRQLVDAANTQTRPTD